jgi:octaprenyl-diphosphate synthase
MASSIDQIKAPVASHLLEFEKRFRDSMRSKVPLLDRITNYIVKRKGKHIRPMFVFLSARLVGEVNDATYHGAAMIELMHTATLVHDDVVDDSWQRRGFFSINALWKNKIAVLVGDYLLSRGLLQAIDNGHFDMLKVLSEAVKEMSEGELLQIEKARKLDIDESVYYEIIRQKTATLIASASEVGALSAGADREAADRIHLFGEKVGMAFQLKDDLFDYGDTKIGKPTHIDIQEKKMTLPLIFTLNKVDRKQKRWIINTVKNHNRDKVRVQELIGLVQQSGGIEYANKVMRGYRDEALEILNSFPENEARQSLEALVHYTIDRSF